MAANIDRGEIDIHIGDQTRTLRFRIEQTMMLEKALGKGVMSYLAAEESQDFFLVQAIFYGLQRRGTKSKVTPPTVAGWLDSADDDSPITMDSKVVDRTDIQKEILFAVARGKPGQEGRDMVRILDEAFNAMDDEETGGGESPSPLASDMNS